jgi:hypothetical protein
MREPTGRAAGLLGRTTRRGVLGLAGAGAAGIIVATTLGEAEAATLETRDTIGGQPTFYHDLNNDTFRRTSFQYNPTFYQRVQAWHAFWRANTPAHWTVPHRIMLNGVYVNKSGAHGEGRAMDISRLEFTNTQTGRLEVGFNGRYDQWRHLTGLALTETRKRYWGTVASLNYHFRDVLHYLYNADHHHHAHADNKHSGSGNSNYTTGSAVQTRFVQASLTYIWGYTTAMDGQWGPQTDGNSRRALARIGVSGGLTSSQANWLAYCRACLRYVSGTQGY